MPKLINITGPIAVGKSTVCASLKKELKNYAFVDRAYLKEMLKPIGKPLAKKIADKTTIFIIKQLMKENKNILVHEQSIVILKEKLKRYSKKYKLYSFFLTCTSKKAVERDIKRTKKSGNLEHVRETHKRIKPYKQDIVVNTEKHSEKETSNIILREIK